MLLEELRVCAPSSSADRDADHRPRGAGGINLNRERAAAEHWRAQHERETEAHDSVQAQIAEIEAQIEGIQMTARGSEKGGAAHLRLRGEMMAAIKKRNAEESTLLAKQREEEAKLTSIYTAHRQQTDRLEFEIATKTNEQHEIGQAMTRWRGQWEEEMTEKNTVAAGATLRSEFEKSSGTSRDSSTGATRPPRPLPSPQAPDKEIEALKEIFERTRGSRSAARREATVTKKNAVLAQTAEWTPRRGG